MDFNAYLDYLYEVWGIDASLVFEATIETFQITFFSLLFTIVLGLPLGILMYLLSPGRMLSSPRLYNIISFFVNILRSMPFIILLITVIPITEFLTGTILGVKGVIPPLVFSAAPFFAKLVEGVLNELNDGMIEASKSMGATTLQTVTMVIIPETLPGIIGAVTVTAISLIGYTAMAGVVGGGGLGVVAVQYGYNLFEMPMLYTSVFLIIIIVQLIQLFGDWLMRRMMH